MRMGSPPYEEVLQLRNMRSATAIFQWLAEYPRNALPSLRLQYIGRFWFMRCLLPLAKASSKSRTSSMMLRAPLGRFRRIYKSLLVLCSWSFHISQTQYTLKTTHLSSPWSDQRDTYLWPMFCASPFPRIAGTMAPRFRAPLPGRRNRCLIT
jgi:hypothetical protein